MQMHERELEREEHAKVQAALDDAQENLRKQEETITDLRSQVSRAQRLDGLVFSKVR